MLHDCGGSVVRSVAGAVSFLCLHCGRPFAILDRRGLHITSKHGAQKDDNTITLAALKVMIAAVEKTK